MIDRIPFPPLHRFPGPGDLWEPPDPPALRWDDDEDDSSQESYDGEEED